LLEYVVYVKFCKAIRRTLVQSVPIEMPRVSTLLVRKPPPFETRPAGQAVPGSHGEGEWPSRARSPGGMAVAVPGRAPACPLLTKLYRPDSLQQ
jgi:hypothetical protein